MIALLGPVGCAAQDAGGASVSAATLKKNLTDSLTQGGVSPQSVTCRQDLPGEPGKTARCDVVVDDANSFEAVFTALRIEGGTVVFDVTPAATRAQLARTVSRLTGSPAVACSSGLDGKVGREAQCDITRGGATVRQTVEVADIDGLAMGLKVLPVLTSGQVQDLLLDKLTADGRRPQAAECAGNLKGKAGATLECVVAADGQRRPYLLTVTAVDGDAIDFEAAPES